VFSSDDAAVCCALNASSSQAIAQALNPTVHFTNNDVYRIALFPGSTNQGVLSTIEAALGSHETHREPSVEFRCPGPSAWRYAQDWAQRAVDRPQGTLLPPFEPEDALPVPASFVSYAVGQAIGRFGQNGEGVVEDARVGALPNGILFVCCEGSDSLLHPACRGVHAAWKKHATAIGSGGDLPTYLRKSFFDYLRRLYENRPIYLPLSSSKRNFVAFVSVHRWNDDTLQVLRADHLLPVKRRLEGELDDLRKQNSQISGRGRSEERFADVRKLLEELGAFIGKVTQVGERGPAPADDATARCATEARFIMDLDDGVMVNSAALWSLLEPQWKDPKKWWKVLATPQGRKNYDWAHLAARYFPKRVRAKCVGDPSLAVAHKCFWELHPGKAYAWELRLQAEIRAGFTIDEPASDRARAHFLRQYPDQARAIVAEEHRRRAGVAARAQSDDGEEAGSEPLQDGSADQADSQGGDEAAPSARPAVIGEEAEQPLASLPGSRRKRGRHAPAGA
jgi:hypothetical protein